MPLILVAMFCFACGCSQEPAPAANAPGSAPAVPDVPAGEGNFDSLKEKYAEALAELPHTPMAGELLEAFIAAAPRPLLDSRKARVERLIEALPGENIAVYAFETQFDAIEAKDDAKALSYARKTRRALPNTAVAAAALDRELIALGAGAPEEFSRQCAEWIAASPDGMEGRVALFRRAAHLRDQGRNAESAMDYLLFWERFPEVVDRMQWAPHIGAALRDAGYVLESDMLSVSDEPSHLAGRIYREFSEMAASGGNSYLSIEGHPIDPSAVQAGVGGEAPLAGCTALLRFARLASHRRDYALSSRLYQEFCAKAFLTTNGSGLDDGEEAVLAGYCEIALRDLVRTRDDWAITSVASNNAEEMTPVFDAAEAGSQLSELWRKMSTPVRSDGLDDDAVAAIAEAVRRHCELLRRIDNIQAVSEAYGQYIAAFPASAAAPEFLMQTAEDYRNVWRSLAQAAQTYGDVREDYPESDWCHKAVLGEAECRVLLGEYEEGLRALSALPEVLDDPDEQVQGLWLKAKCEDALDLGEMCAYHMAQLVAEHGAHPKAAEILFWYACSLMNRGRNEEALAHFERIVESHSASASAQWATQHATRLREELGLVQ